MSLSWQIVAAIGLDLVCGDPRWLPHPVRLMGRLALALEPLLRRRYPSQRQAGVVMVLLLLGIIALVCSALLGLAAAVHPWLESLVAVLLIYFSLAACDLRRHAVEVYRALQGGDLPLARQRVGMLVGRNTQSLDEVEIVRATVESVAENSVDGVTAPLLFALCCGPVGAMLYKGINTLDSTFGYRNQTYLEFGWASARLDDLANLLPARLTALLVPPAAWLLNLDAANAWRIFLRDRHQHPSPNGGQIEAAMAGALGVRLGGENRYFGRPGVRPFLGDPLQPLRSGHILQVNRLMLTTAALLAGLGLMVRILWG